jgi:uncharacterized membrane protein
MYSILLSVNLDWIYKVIYPILYSLVPLVLYLAYREQTGPRIALLSTFLLMFVNSFYFTMLGLARQMIAGLFLALLIFLILDRRMPLGKRRLLFLVFGAGLIVSHYAVSYIFMFCIVFALCFTRFFKGSQMKPRGVLSIDTVLLYMALTFSWYVFVSPIQIEAVTNVGSHIWGQILGFVAPPGVTGLVPSYVSPLHESGTFVFLAVQLFVIVGLLLAILTSRRRMFSSEYLAFSASSMLVLAACVGIPSFAASLQVSRFHHVTMFFLAPFGALGGIITLNSIGRRIASLGYVGSKLTKALSNSGATITTVLIVSLLLFQIGFVYEIAGDVPISTSLSIERRDVWPSYLDSAIIPVQDVISAEWLSGNTPHASSVYGDWGNTYGVLISYAMIPKAQLQTLTDTTPVLKTGEYLYLGSVNTIYGKLDMDYGFSNTSQLRPLLNDMNVIYSNGQSQIFWFP